MDTGEELMRKPIISQEDRYISRMFPNALYTHGILLRIEKMKLRRALDEDFMLTDIMEWMDRKLEAMCRAIWCKL
jgi:hypothetical protein